jgi:acyl-CoA synthetase (AMP-forming)/AMP-acid ligase II
MMRGYWNLPEATAETLVDGWLHTGDAGYLDDEGFLYLSDRLKDMIVSGGENIYPREIEEVISAMPGVLEAAVIGVPDTRWGESVKACVVAEPGHDLTVDDVITWCRDHLATFKAPRSVDFLDALPRNPSGKVLKRELRHPYWSGQARQVG